MNLAVDIRSIMYGKYTGIGEYTYQLLDHVFELDREQKCFLFCNSQKPTHIPDWHKRYANVSQTVFTYPNKALHGSILALRRPNIQRMLEKRVHHGMDRLFLPNQNFMTWRDDTKLIVTIHDLSFVRFPEFFTPFHRFWHRAVNLKRMAQQAHRIISVSHHTARDLQELWRIPAEKIRVIHPGLDPIFHQSPVPAVSPSAAIEMPQEYVLYLGTLEPRKNIEFILDVFDGIAADHPKLHLVLAGGWGWETEGIKKRLAASPYAARIKLLGYVDRSMKPELYRKAKAFIFPSFYEGFGFPPLEAMSQGCPVLTSNHSSLPEVVEDGAVTLPVTDLTPWMLVLDEILRRPADVVDMIERGKKIAARYQWRDAASRTLSVLTET
jgi:glycosyltransferase involved in cell wall biosynthesis